MKTLSQGELESIKQCAAQLAEDIWNDVVCEAGCDNHKKLFQKLCRMVARELTIALMGGYEESEDELSDDDLERLLDKGNAISDEMEFSWGGSEPA